MKLTYDFAPIILKNLNKPWESVFHCATRLSFSGRQLVASYPGNAAQDGMYYVVSGRVCLSYIAANGAEKVLFYVGSGTIFNEIPMLVHTKTAIFTAMAPTTVYFWHRKDLPQIFFEHPLLVNNLLESLSLKASNFYLQLCSMGLFDSFTNVCRALCSMHTHNQEGNRIVPMLTQQELATFLGIHRSSLHNALTRLKDEDIITKYTKNELIITDLAALQHYASELDEA